ncbi:hypothetical protein AVEN_126515-1 [Araneus ventricosus]|uniref:Uncharacterized protein n=1 Tax=Araneus ventricosus TaxID=182803 RepID=A0A4Y2J2U3_ARAVE|nr:hypothetical protein AVEN_223532-1 [Araneus ventricosus]GBM84182.1 hypothetical protein AVEN_255723-1 [Araneus ventricosus]GBM84206.1 hypothetical protein AVEN_123950-1 [Araneus ventricosus]GBM84220.1 hypothetical protein AVEN_126515-1 [Araneus ventricosus]
MKKNRSSVDRTREFSPQSLIVITIDKRALVRFLSSSKNLSRSIFALLFLTIIFSPLRKRSKASPRILVNLVGGVYFNEPLLVPYLLVLLLSQAGSQSGDK